MDKVKIAVLSQGNPRNFKTWSGVPAYLCTSLEKLGYNVVTCNFGSNLIHKALQKIIDKLFFSNNKNSEYSYERTKFFNKCCKIKINHFVKKNNDAVLYITTNLSHCPDVATKGKTILLGDWTFEELIKRNSNREPNKKEKEYIEFQKENVNKAYGVISIFKDCAGFISLNYHKKAEYFGFFINTDCKQFDTQSTIIKRYSSNNIIFIGKKKYESGLRALVNAIELYNKENSLKLHINIIGMKSSETDINSDYISFYGKLNKSIQDENELYYKLINDAFLIANTNEKWAGISSITELMYYACPVITSNINEFENLFSKDINFGYYCNNDS